MKKINVLFLIAVIMLASCGRSSNEVSVSSAEVDSDTVVSGVKVINSHKSEINVNFEGLDQIGTSGNETIDEVKTDSDFYHRVVTAFTEKEEYTKYNEPIIFKDGNHYYKCYIMRQCTPNSETNQTYSYMSITHDPNCEMRDLIKIMKMCTSQK